MTYHGSNGAFIAMDLIRAMQDQKKGEAIGYGEIERMTTRLKTDLEEKIQQLDNKNKPQD